MNTCWAKYALFLIIVLLGTSSMVTACGKKGDLYLPDQQKNQKA
ncbi:MAG TPA: hypothetical protein ENI65_06815 [Gammaproteobacteria bacterium]|nr:hypothetical protein [Gammaproteobacteria bacterium]